MSEARGHAVMASELLAGVERYQEQLRNLSDDDKLQRQVTGAIGRDNANIDYTVQLAMAQALTALALAITEDAHRTDYVPEGDD